MTIRIATAMFAVLCLAGITIGQTRKDVIVEVEHFGVGNVYRQGELTGIRLQLTADPGGSLGEATMVWVQWEVPDGNGDIAEYGRTVTLTRGRPTPVWLYAPLPPNFTLDDLCTVRVFEFVDGRRRLELGGRRFRPGDAIVRPDIVNLQTGLIGVLGQRHMGLRGYADGHAQSERPISAHERTRLVLGIRPTELPDRWDGLRGFEAIVWAAPSPSELTSDTAGALREYIRRGGHLIIIMPQDINPWRFGSRGQTLLEDILPQTDPRRDDGVHVRELLPIMSKAPDTPANFSMSMRVFRDDLANFDAIDNFYEPLIALPDGRVVVIQRIFGHGRITICGIDVASGQLNAAPLSIGSAGLPQADVFWNRVLGRRTDTPSPGELELIADEKMLARATGANVVVGAGNLVSNQIAMTTQAGLGLLLALVLFAAYWLLAGPVGYGLLKAYKQVRHAWLAFVAVAAVFTAIAWGIVSLIRVKEPRIQHLTVLDHIARPVDESRPGDPQLQRAASWFELYVPGYTRPRVSLHNEPGQRNLLLPWIPPGDAPQRFPNIVRYAVDVGANPGNYTIPARSTSTQMYAHWMGGLDPNWGRMIRSHPDDPVRVITDAAGNELGLSGAIVHDLPTTLRDVTIIWVRNTRISTRQYATRSGQPVPWVPPLTSGRVLNTGSMFRVSQLQKGDVLDLRQLRVDGQADLQSGIDRRYVDKHRSGPALGRPTMSPLAREALEMLSIFHQLTPPPYLLSQPDSSPTRVIFHRRLGREIDLSAWFSRPALIVIGYVDGEIPLPIRLNNSDRPIASSGTTMVRWIYPLSLDERIAFDQPSSEPLTQD